jgi:hypothetical protein
MTRTLGIAFYKGCVGEEICKRRFKKCQGLLNIMRVIVPLIIFLFCAAVVHADGVAEPGVRDIPVTNTLDNINDFPGWTFIEITGGSAGPGSGKIKIVGQDGVVSGRVYAIRTENLSLIYDRMEALVPGATTPYGTALFNESEKKQEIAAIELYKSQNISFPPPLKSWPERWLFMKALANLSNSPDPLSNSPDAWSRWLVMEGSANLTNASDAYMILLRGGVSYGPVSETSVLESVENVYHLDPTTMSATLTESSTHYNALLPLYIIAVIVGGAGCAYLLLRRRSHDGV